MRLTATDFVFRAVEESCDVGAVEVGDEEGHGGGADDDGVGLLESPGVKLREDEEVDGQKQRGGDAGEADVFEGFENEEKGEEGDECGEGEIGIHAEDAAEPSGDAFAALELEPDGEDVAEDSEDEDSEPEAERGGGELIVGVAEEFKCVAGDEDGKEAFEHVECEAEEAELFTEDSAGVGGTDVT